MLLRQILPIFLITVIVITGCKKDNNECDVSGTLTSTSLKPTIGDNITITFEGVGDDRGPFQWNTPKMRRPNATNTLDVSDIKLSDRGWYYCIADNMGCNGVLVDSVFIDVQLAQEEAPCTLTNNLLSGTGIPQTTVQHTVKRIHSTWNGLALEATGPFGQPPYTILFNSYLGTQQPKDGVYITQEGPSFAERDELNAISVSFVHNSNYYHSYGGQKVYVKHVNGKLQVSFCSLNFSPTVRVSGRITEL